MSSAEEILDLVDENDQVVGSKPRSEVYAEGLSNFRVVNAFIVNSEGKIWIPRRAANKRLFPLGLDMSMGGHVSSGESYEEAFGRELEEELGLNAEATPHPLLGHLSPNKDGVSAFMNVYEIKSDSIPNFNKSDFIEYYWLTPEELLKKLATGDKSKSDLPKLVKKFYPSVYSR
ncbi:MAG TPA: NUDIX hydrolase [Candidatus Paceibacterota bacterium]